MPRDVDDLDSSQFSFSEQQKQEAYQDPEGHPELRDLAIGVVNRILYSEAGGQ